MRLIVLIIGFISIVFAQRIPAVAGKFYPQDKATLSSQIEQYFNLSHSKAIKQVNALIVPHAGYVYSGSVAASAYKTLHKRYKNIFIIGSSHYQSFDGASVYNIGDYITPLGVVKVNKDIASQLIRNSSFFTFDKQTHTKEHTIEVQLPFLQMLYGDNLRIIPIIIATHNLKTIQSIAKILQPYLNDENLFVISSDLSHYPSSYDANVIDIKLLDSLKANNPLDFLNAMKQSEEAKIDGLVTPACGWSSLLTLLFMTQHSAYTYELLEYKNSADSQYGEPQSVVGYGAVRVYQDEKTFLTKSEQKELLTIARNALSEIINNKQKLRVEQKRVSPKLTQPLGAFVTLNKNHTLRGCIGSFQQDKPLYQTVIDMTIAAALHDERFKEVSFDELKDIEIEISVLTPRKRVYSFDDIIIGRDGIYIQKGIQHGTYLPQVAIQMGWDAKEFVSHCSQEKAGIGKDGYKDAEVYTYEAVVFKE